ncbi:MAG: PAS domain S-box protein [Deltaproteobacteria bacterium]|nr:PAS domain S-box protein [Deltaproteobacteria bacterium]
MSETSKTSEQWQAEVAGLRERLAELKERQKALEESFRASDESFREWAENLPQSLFEFDTTGKFTYVNRQGYEAFGYDEKDLETGVIVTSLVIPEDRMRAFTNIEKILGGDLPDDVEYTALRKDGGTFHAFIHSGPVLQDGKVMGLRGICIDITDRKQMEQELVKHRDSLEEMVAERTDELKEANVRLQEEINERRKAEVEIRSVSRFPDEDPSPVLRVSGKARLLYANGASAFLLSEWGCKAGDPIPADMGRAVEEALASGRDRVIDMECAGRYLSFMVAPITGEGYVNLYGRDMTEHRRIEERFRSLQKMEAIGTLAGGVAHDFNNLLTTIIGQTDLAMMELDAGRPAAAQLDEVYEASMRASALTRQLLLFSRKQPMETMPVDINCAVVNLLKMIKRIIGEDIEVKVELEPELWSVEADPGNIEQVIVNLAVNARDAMPGGGTVTIKTENSFLGAGFLPQDVHVSQGNHVCLSLTDTGTGMDSDTLHHIFEPFFTTKEAGKGTGLGLSVVYGIVRKHKGWVDVISHPGKGSTFLVYLPASAPVAGEEVEARDSFELYRGQGEVVLLVEDDPSVRSLVSAALSSNGYEVREAGSYDEAISVFEKDPGAFQFILSDVVLPDKSGIQIVETLLSRRPDLKILLCSGYTDEKSQWSVIKERNYNFLEKPFNVATLLQRVREAIIA